MQQNQHLDEIMALKQQVSTTIINMDEQIVKLVIFELNTAWFAFPAENIKEILSQSEIFFVPGCPHSLKGVVNVRGDIESVICLAELLGEVATDKSFSPSILLAQGNNMQSGLLVDKIIDVLDVLQRSIQPPLNTFPENLRPLVAGLIEHQTRLIAILDLNRIFDHYAQGLT